MYLSRNLLKAITNVRKITREIKMKEKNVIEKWLKWWTGKKKIQHVYNWSPQKKKKGATDHS